jgi:hypothetical protein
MSGDQLWAHQTPWPIENAPAVSDGSVYCSNGDCYLEALSLDGETTEWRFKTHRGINAPPAVVNETVYVGSGGLSNDDVRLHAVDAATGEQEWIYELHHQSVTPVVSDGTVYASDGKVLHAIDAKSGDCRWTYDVYPSALTAPSIVGDTLYLGRNNGLHWSNGPVGLDVISAETGELETQLEMDGSLKSPMIANGTIYCGDDTGEMVALKSAE